ncbi:hypothetical protein Taro_044311, partial [Colocasia esculenta]|nr:hypothetical protein [Colocasia esculenta]
SLALPLPIWYWYPIIYKAFSICLLLFFFSFSTVFASATFTKATFFDITFYVSIATSTATVSSASTIIIVSPLLVLTSSPSVSPPPSSPPPPPSYPPPLPQPLHPDHSEPRKQAAQECNLFKGRWVPNGEAPYYTNTTCWMIQEHQNCMKYGRPDTEFLKWRWKPDDCELPVFDPARFLELVRGKAMAFVGDSLARNQMQSLMCLLSKVEYPKDISSTSDENFKRMYYRTYDFTIFIFWSPFLVRTEGPDREGPLGLWKLHLDEVDKRWMAHMKRFDYLIISGGNWFTRPSMYYRRKKLVGCNYCQSNKVPMLSLYTAHRRAFHTALRAIIRSKGYKGLTFLRTVSPQHFENGKWNEGGDCPRTRPHQRNEARMDGMDLRLYKDQLHEFREADKVGRRQNLRFKLLDTTQAMVMRPDGHPSRYGHWPQANEAMYNDCVHWCLPGPIDMWNDMLLQMLNG